MSKQPFVNTIFLPFPEHLVTMFCISSKLFMCASEVLLCKLASYSSISSILTVAEPILPTTTPAARFANRAVSSIVFPRLKAKAIEAITVSPAPVTSKTSFATVGNFFTLPSCVAIPSSERVIKEIPKSHSVFNFKSASSRLLSSFISIPVARTASFLFGVKR